MDTNFDKGIKCQKCGYFNQYYNYKKFETCKLCGSVIDKKAKFRYEMYNRLRLWRKNDK